MINFFTDLVNAVSAATEQLTVPKLLVIMILLFVTGWYYEVFVLGKTHRRAMDVMDRSLKINERTFNIMKRMLGKDE